jgi:hypothetical protein
VSVPLAIEVVLVREELQVVVLVPLELQVVVLLVLRADLE